MKKEMNGFKVIRKKTRRSCRLGWSSEWGLFYPLNEEVSANVKGTKLFFFQDIEDAEAFVSKNTEVVVPCIAKNVVKVKWVCNQKDEIEKFWKKRSKCKGKSVAPEGTYLAESITCLE